MNCPGENCGRLDEAGWRGWWKCAGQLVPSSLRGERMPPRAWSHLAVLALLPFASRGEEDSNMEVGQPSVLKEGNQPLTHPSR